MLSIFLTFIWHLPLGKSFSFGRLNILFGTERILKLIMMKPSMKSVVMTSPGHTHSTAKWKN
jgi:hypothetical protein